MLCKLLHYTFIVALLLLLLHVGQCAEVVGNLVKHAGQVSQVVISSTTTVYGVTTVTVYPENPATVPPESTQHVTASPGTAVVIYSISTVFLTTIYQTSHSTYYTTLYNTPSVSNDGGHYVTSTSSVGFPVVVVTANGGASSMKGHDWFYNMVLMCAALAVSSLAVLLY